MLHAPAMPRFSALRVVLSVALLLLGALEGARAIALLGVAGPYPLAAQLVLAVLASVAGIGLWWRTRYAAPAILALGVVFAATRLIDALVLGIRPWLFALLAALAALLFAFVLAAFARQEAELATAAGGPL